MEDEDFCAEVNVRELAAKLDKAASDAAPRAAASIDFPPLLPKGQGEMHTVANLAAVETAVSPTIILQKMLSGIGNMSLTHL